MKNLLKKTLIATLFAVVIYLILFLFLDKYIDTFMYAHVSNTWFFQLGTIISNFAKSTYITSVIAICFIAIVIFDRGENKPWAKSLLYICVSVSIAVIIGSGLKYLLARYRPIELFENNHYGLHFFSPEWSINSTPSGHTLRAFSILSALSFIFKKFKIIFITCAILIGASRVIVTDHYLSDVVFGAYVGIFTALWTY